MWGLALAQCGDGEALSKKIEIKFVPELPLVLDADLTLFPGQERERIIKAPWFLVYPEVINKTGDHTLYLVAIRYNIFGAGRNVEVVPEPGASCDVDGFGRAYMVILSPLAGQNRYVGADYIGSDACDPTDYDSQIREGWYIDDLPTNGSSSGFSYGVNTEALGWIADATGTPIERLINFSGFGTQ